MVATPNKSGWVIAEDIPLEISVQQLLVPFPILRETYHHYGLPDPRSIIGTSIYVLLGITTAT